VVGQLARDLVLTIDGIPEAGASADAAERREQLGGKGANQAVGLAQLGVRPALVAVAGDDRIGDVLLDRARRDGIDVTAVVRRPGVPTGLIVELLTGAEYRYIEHLPLLTVADIERHATLIGQQDAVLVQLQQPADVATAAARIGHAAGRLVVLDGTPEDEELLAYADVVRADEKEAQQLSDTPRELLKKGPRLVAVAVEDGNLFVWADGELHLPLTGGPVVDTTGGGDAFVAALTASLLHGDPYPEVARRATAASGATVSHAGGRPDLAGTAARD
jgi:ribokinase